MRWFLLYVSLPLVYCVAVNNLKSLTESMGQEVIEMDAPLKELPPDLEEEPSAEKDGDVQPITTTHLPATKVKETKRKMKEPEKIDSVQQEEDEARIEKELADLYKDTSDYKADSAEVSKDQSEATNETPAALATEEYGDKPIGRARNDFKFQPDSFKRADVERFRTSVDVISCDRKGLTGSTMKPYSSGQKHTSNGIIVMVIFCKHFLIMKFLF